MNPRHDQKPHIGSVLAPARAWSDPRGFCRIRSPGRAAGDARFAPYVTGRLIRLERNRPHRTESLRSDETGAIAQRARRAAASIRRGPGATARRKPSGLWGASAWRQNPPPSGSLERFTAFLRLLSSFRNPEI